MTIAKRTVNINDKNKYISILLENKNASVGEDQSFDTLTINNSIDIINPVIDVETYKFKINSTGTNLQFNFHDLTRTEPKYDIVYKTTGFTNVVLQNSYFIMDIFDSFDIQKQTRLNRNYFTQLNPNNSQLSGLTSTFILSSTVSNQFNNVFIPKNYLDSNINNEIILYCKFMFYDALNGKIVNFINQSKLNISTNDKMFFEINLNKSSRVWHFNNNVTAYGDILSIYSEKINAAIQTQTDKTESYPTGNKFDYTTIDYSVIQ